MASELTTAVVICAYSLQRWELLVKGIEAVLGQTHPPARVIVVIDHNDELLDRVHQQFGDHVVLLANAERQGLSGARNTGVAAAKEDVLAFLDDDALPAPDWLATLAFPYGDDRVLGVGGSIEPAWESQRPNWFPPEFDWVIGCTYLGMSETAGPVRNLIGANMSVRRSVFDRVGDFTHDLGHRGAVPFGCEETELCIRAQQATPGGVFWHQPHARVSHWVSDDRVRFTYFRKRCFGEGSGKALMSGLVGSSDGLSSERRYVTRVLPAGIVRGILSSLRHGKPDGALRAAAIMAGLGIVTAGFLIGCLRARTR